MSKISSMPFVSCLVAVSLWASALQSEGEALITPFKNSSEKCNVHLDDNKAWHLSSETDDGNISLHMVSSNQSISTNFLVLKKNIFDVYSGPDKGEAIVLTVVGVVFVSLIAAVAVFFANSRRSEKAQNQTKEVSSNPDPALVAAKNLQWTESLVALHYLHTKDGIDASATERIHDEYADLHRFAIRKEVDLTWSDFKKVSHSSLENWNFRLFISHIKPRVGEHEVEVTKQLISKIREFYPRSELIEKFDADPKSAVSNSKLLAQHSKALLQKSNKCITGKVPEELNKFQAINFKK